MNSECKSPTIATPSIMALHQSRPPTTEFQAAVTNERPVWDREQALNTPPAFTALQSPCLAGSFEGIAVSQDSWELAAKPPLGKEITVCLPKSKSPLPSSGALGPKPVCTKKIEDEPESSKCPRPVANACRDAGRLEDGGERRMKRGTCRLEGQARRIKVKVTFLLKQ